MQPVKEDRLPERTLILTASVGAGHTRAAEAVRSALARDRPAREEPPRVVDVLAHTTRLFRRAYRGGYLALVRSCPALVGALYDRTDHVPSRGAARRRDRALRLVGASGIARMLRRERPDAVVCTHFLASAIAAHLIERGELDCRLSIVVTDIDAHAIWCAPTCHRYFVASDLARRRLRSFGIDDARIERTGIPIDLHFAEPTDRGEARVRLGLPQRGPIVLVTGGGVGVGPIVSIVEDLLAIKRKPTIVAVAGRNAALEAALRRCESAHGPTLRVHGFTERMAELMAAADLLVGKPGGLTSSEALACGLPMVIVAPVPGQEERNADHLLELGVAVRCRDRSSVAWKIDALLEDPHRLAVMRRRARAAATPDAALAIARSVRAAERSSADVGALPFSLQSQGILGSTGRGSAALPR